MKFFNTLTKKIVATVALIAVVAGISSVAIAGFGPDRPIKAWTPTVSGFDHVVFNSFTGVGNGIGDERDFARGSVVGTQANWSDPVNNIPDGAEVEVKVYIHNNADSSLNATNPTKGIAKNVNVKVSVPNVSSQSQDITSYISADNALPQQIFDTLTLTGENGGFFELSPVSGSAKIFNQDGTSSAVDDSVFTTGANIGDQMGCFQYRREITFRVKVKMPNYSISKETKVTGQPNWVESVNGQPTDMFSWIVTVTNTGKTELKNIKVVDNVPANMNVVPGTVTLTNGNYPNGYVYDASALQNNGRQINVDIGNYNPEGIAYITYRTTVAPVEQLTCGENSFVNEAFATPAGYGAIRDIATARVTKTNCTVTTPEFTCNNATIEKLGGRKIKATVTYNGAPANRVVFKNVEYSFGDGSMPLVATANTAEHTFAKDGTYKVSAKVTFAVDGVNQTVTNESCAQTVTFSTTPPELPKTGSSTTLGMFIATTLLGMFAFRAYAVRKN